MTNEELPTAGQRRRWLQEASPQLKEAGRAYLQADRLTEALECFANLEDAQGLSQVEAQARETGDFFVWRQALQRLERQPTDSELQKIKDRALAMGKNAFAQAAQALLEKSEDKK